LVATGMDSDGQKRADEAAEPRGDEIKGRMTHAERGQAE